MGTIWFSRNVEFPQNYKTQETALFNLDTYNKSQMDMISTQSVDFNS
jgi:hypothetical protein